MYDPFLIISIPFSSSSMLSDKHMSLEDESDDWRKSYPATVPLRQEVYISYSDIELSNAIPVMASPWSYAWNTGETVLRSHTLINPSSSPEIITWSFRNLHLLIGEGCAFFIIWAISPLPSKKPNLLSSLQEANTEYVIFYDCQWGWKYSNGLTLYGHPSSGLKAWHHQRCMRV